MCEERDASLIEAVGAGDEAAFSVLYRRYLPLVVRWCLRETGDRELAADLAAEVFAASLLAARRFDPDRGSVAGWLVGIARKKLLASLRHKRIEDAARRRLGLEPVAITDADLERVDSLASREQDILSLLDQLPAEQRQALVSHVIGERSYREIALELQCSESVVRQRVSRGLKTLRSRTEKP